MNMKLTAGSRFPEFDLPLAGGGQAHFGGAGEGWRLIVVYRGRHCPLCKKYLTRLKDLAGEYAAAGIDLMTVSGDPLEKAEADKADLDLPFPVAYGLGVEGMKDLGLYVSHPRSPQETDRPFPEPGVFVLNPQGDVQIIDISNAPFARPDLENLLGGIKFVQASDYPIRGTAS